MFGFTFLCFKPGPLSLPRLVRSGMHDYQTSSDLFTLPRVAACAAQNQELQRKVQELERHNM